MKEMKEKSISLCMERNCYRCPPQVHDVYRSLLNMGSMHSNLIARWTWMWLNTPWIVIMDWWDLCTFKGPQVAYVDLCIGNELTSYEFRRHFFTGIHRADFPDSLVKGCDVYFDELAQKIEPDRLHSFAMAITENKQLPGMNLQYFHRIPCGIPLWDPRFFFAWFGWSKFIGRYCFIHISLIYWIFEIYIAIELSFCSTLFTLLQMIFLVSIFYISLVFIITIWTLQDFSSVAFFHLLKFVKFVLCLLFVNL